MRYSNLKICTTVILLDGLVEYRRGKYYGEKHFREKYAVDLKNPITGNSLRVNS